LQLPRVIRHPAIAITWLGFAETLALAAGAWIILAEAAQSESTVVSDRAVRIARYLFAVALPVIGLSHFVYVDATAALVPAWLPHRTALAYLTGAAHAAAGVGILVGFFPRVVAALGASMITSFTLLVWGPRVVAAPASRAPWTALLVSSALSGAAWTVTQSFGHQKGES